MKAELIEGDATAGEDMGWEGAAAGIDRSRRSLSPDPGDTGFGGAAAVGEDRDEERSPKPLALGCLLCVCACVVGAGLGLESKKLPPPPNRFEEDVEAGERDLESESRPAKGDGFAGGAAGCELKDKSLNASLRPPRLDC